MSKCPQCGTGEGIYAEYPCSEAYVQLLCLCCGFRMRNYLDPQNDDERNHTEEPGYGIKKITFDQTLMVGPGQFDALTSNTDYEKELALYDQFVSMGVVDKEKSYITKAEGSSITFLRGEKKNIKNAFDEKYNKYIALAISNGEVNDEDGLFMLHRRLSKRMFKSAAT